MNTKDLSIEELVKLVKNENKPKREKKPRVTHSSVIKFIQQLNIQSGDVKVPTFVIYYYYRRIWRNYDNNSKVNRTLFFRSFKLNFEATRHGDQRFYKLNDCFEINEDIVRKALAYQQKNRSQRRAKKYKKEAK